MSNIISNIYGNNQYSGGELFSSNSGNFHTKDPLKVIKEEIQKTLAKKKQVLIFKWKPHEFLPELIHNKQNYVDTFKYIKSKGYKVVYNYRNFLDVYISHEKVDDLKGTTVSAYNCFNTKCADKRAEIKVNIATTKDMLKDIKIQDTQHNNVMRSLNQYKISYHIVNYELLNVESTEKKLKYLQKLVTFLNPNLKATISLYDTNVKFSSSYHQKDIVKNYEDIQKALNKTKYEYLLHP